MAIGQQPPGHEAAQEERAPVSRGHQRGRHDPGVGRLPRIRRDPRAEADLGADVEEQDEGHQEQLGVEDRATGAILAAGRPAGGFGGWRPGDADREHCGRRGQHADAGVDPRGFAGGFEHRAGPERPGDGAHGKEEAQPVHGARDVF